MKNPGDPDSIEITCKYRWSNIKSKHNVPLTYFCCRLPKLNFLIHDYEKLWSYENYENYEIILCILLVNTYIEFLLTNIGDDSYVSMTTDKRISKVAAILKQTNYNCNSYLFNEIKPRFDFFRYRRAFETRNILTWTAVANVSFDCVSLTLLWVS